MNTDDILVYQVIQPGSSKNFNYVEIEKLKCIKISMVSIHINHRDISTYHHMKNTEVKYNVTIPLSDYLWSNRSKSFLIPVHPTTSVFLHIIKQIINLYPELGLTEPSLSDAKYNTRNYTELP